MKSQHGWFTHKKRSIIAVCLLHIKIQSPGDVSYISSSRIAFPSHRALSSRGDEAETRSGFAQRRSLLPMSRYRPLVSQSAKFPIRLKFAHGTHRLNFRLGFLCFIFLSVLVLLLFFSVFWLSANPTERRRVDSAQVSQNLLNLLNSPAGCRQKVQVWRLPALSKRAVNVCDDNAHENG